MHLDRKILLTGNGCQLVVKKITNSHKANRIVVIAGAMAVHQNLYFHFAEYLVSCGSAVWTFDYDGIGESRNKPLSECTSDITDWINDSFESVIQLALEEDVGLDLFVIGHSLGGQIAPLLRSATKVSGLVNIAVGSGATLHLQPKLRRFAPFLWHFVAPLTCRVFGYFPGKMLHFVGNVPKQAFLQWRRWCLSSEYLLTGEPMARESYSKSKFPVLSLIFSDDELLLESGSDLLHKGFVDNLVDYRIIYPETFGLKKIGHFGFFRSSNANSLWPLVSEWIVSQEKRVACGQP